MPGFIKKVLQPNIIFRTVCRCVLILGVRTKRSHGVRSDSGPSLLSKAAKRCNALLGAGYVSFQSVYDSPDLFSST